MKCKLIAFLVRLNKVEEDYWSTLGVHVRVTVHVHVRVRVRSHISETIRGINLKSCMQMCLGLNLCPIYKLGHSDLYVTLG